MAPGEASSTVAAKGLIKADENASFRLAPGSDGAWRHLLRAESVGPGKIRTGPGLARLLLGIITGRDNMLWTICVVLLILWALGMVTSYTMGGFLHVLLILAVVVLLIRVIQGRRSII